MDRPRQYAIEAHPGAATLYLAGTVSVRALLDAMEVAETLPSDAWLLRVDVTAAEPLDDGTATVLAHLLRRWSERRTGMTLIVSAGAAQRQARAALGSRRLRHSLATWRAL